MNNHSNEMYDQCKKYMHAYVLAETNDGTSFDGIITGLDNEFVYFAVPNDNSDSEYRTMNNDYRQFGYPGYGYGGGYGGYGGFGYGGPGRFRRLILPLAALTALTLLPWY
ncbi:hypothetical protein [Oceanobacillus sp. FSL H7-0719]|uniref:hypothetical protein n=1 Tax=Oceanobacillus sp. FSL H7-0719 TaxID=2954507 RepID=UPI003252CC75